MKAVFSFFQVLLVLFGQSAFSQIVSAPAAGEKSNQFEVRSSRAIRLPDGTGRRLTMERVRPPVLPPPPAEAVPVPLNPAVLAARRAERLRFAPKERRVLSLTAIGYANGLTWLQWSAPGKDLSWKTYSAWSNTDFRSLWLLQQFRLKDIEYNLFPVWVQAGPHDLKRHFPAPRALPPADPGFTLVEGDPGNMEAIEPIIELHKIYLKNGASLHSQWLAEVTEHQAAAARLKANPPPVEDIVVRVWPVRSNIYAGEVPSETAPLPAGKAR